MRTDIPAFYSKWLINRIKAGFVLVRNPYNPAQVTRYSLSPKVVDLMVFCTKNPAPMLPYMDYLKSYGQYWFVTITPYGKDIEPNVPNKGKVMEIGIRSTKLLGPGNEIKTINNSSIGNVLNLSKMTSFCTVKFTVRATEPLEEIEAMLEKEMPAYKDKIPGMIKGPRYLGVASVADGKMTLEIGAETKEENRYDVERGLNRMLQSLYERKLLHSEKKITNVLVEYSDK